MSRTGRKRAARRAIDRHGRDVTLRNYESSSETDYGEEWSETSGSPHTIKALVERRRELRTNRTAEQSGQIESEVAIYVKDDTTAATNLRDGGGRGATQIDVDGETYLVIRSDDQDNGLLLLHCRRT